MIESDKAVSTLRSHGRGGRWEGTATNLLEALRRLCQAAASRRRSRARHGDLRPGAIARRPNSAKPAKVRRRSARIAGQPARIIRTPEEGRTGVAANWRPDRVAYPPWRRSHHHHHVQLSRPLHICVPDRPMRPQSTSSRRPQQIKTKACEKTRAASRDANGTQGDAGRTQRRGLRPTISALERASKYARAWCGDKRDANSPDLSSLQQPRDASEERGAGGIKRKFKSSPCA